jgi:hypothetical protein
MGFKNLKYVDLEIIKASDLIKLMSEPDSEGITGQRFLFLDLATYHNHASNPNKVFKF